MCRLAEDCVQKVRAMEALDVCSQHFSSSRSEEAVRRQARRMLCDVLMDQAVMPGVGNIIKNEALFDSGLHPAVKVRKKMMDCTEQENNTGSWISARLFRRRRLSRKSQTRRDAARIKKSFHIHLFDISEC